MSAFRGGVAALALAALVGCSSGSGATSVDGDDDGAAMDADGDADSPPVDAGDDGTAMDADDVADAPPLDEGDDGAADDAPPPGPCDDGLALDSADPLEAARAIGLCDGVLSAQWVLPDGTAPSAGASFDLGHGLLSAFGPNVEPREGHRLLALSTGTARTPSDAGYQLDLDKGYAGPAPPGYPRESPVCPGVVGAEPHDGIGLEVTLRVPSGATGFAFDANYYTHDFPDFVCSTYDDVFLALLSPAPVGLPDGNVAYDVYGNPVGVNGGFLQACSCSGGPPCTAGGLSFACSLGAALLAGTGFDDAGGMTAGGATGWLEMRAPATAGDTILLRFMTYDSGDGTLTSTVLLDGFHWLTEPGVTVGTTLVP